MLKRNCSRGMRMIPPIRMLEIVPSFMRRRIVRSQTRSRLAVSEIVRRMLVEVTGVRVCQTLSADGLALETEKGGFHGGPAEPNRSPDFDCGNPPLIYPSVDCPGRDVTERGDACSCQQSFCWLSNNLFVTYDHAK